MMGYVCESTHPIFAKDDRSGVAPIDMTTIAEDIGIARSRGADRLVISLHWGAEEVGLPKPQDVLIAQNLLELGIDLVIGHHAHRRQPLLVKGAQHVFFGLGNALFPDFEYK